MDLTPPQSLSTQVRAINQRSTESFSKHQFSHPSLYNQDLTHDAIRYKIESSPSRAQNSPSRKFSKTILQYKAQIKNMREYLRDLENRKFTPKKDASYPARTF